MADIKELEAAGFYSYDLILTTEDTFYKLGDIGANVSSHRQMDGNAVCLNHKREVVTVWFKNEQRLLSSGVFL